jgi:hypothetical protein
MKVLRRCTGRGTCRCGAVFKNEGRGRGRIQAGGPVLPDDVVDLLGDLPVDKRRHEGEGLEHRVEGDTGSSEYPERTVSTKKVGHSHGKLL